MTLPKTDDAAEAQVETAKKGRGKAPAGGVASEARPLIGMKAIREYMSRSDSTVMMLHHTQGFPMRKIGGSWETDANLVDRWRRMMAAGATVEEIEDALRSEA